MKLRPSPAHWFEVVVPKGDADERAVLQRTIEADRCYFCFDAPCTAACPTGIDIPGFIAKMIGKDFEGAWNHLTDSTLLPAVCGRVCPQEEQCEGVCPVGDRLEPVAVTLLRRQGEFVVIDAEPLAGRVRWISSDAAFTPYYALTERDRSRLTYAAKVDITEEHSRLPDGVPVEVELLVDE